MVNYCILNGVKSNTVKGLLIQSLPAISKPLIRTQIEEIDGRDGDIVTPLGYSAYNKEMTIGLFGDYDIDNVIAFFDSKGQVTFSNEPDKYYNYEIINQIDFERLIRFKTAKVTFHVQPFKYDAVDQSFTFNNQDAQDEAYSFTIRNRGNVNSKPTITVYGSGAINLYLNGEQIFVINLDSAGYVTIDASQMNAYQDNTLMNRSVIGDYDNLSLNIGTNIFSWTGDVTEVIVEDFSRWI